jgi:hypothetical protein
MLASELKQEDLRARGGDRELTPLPLAIADLECRGGMFYAANLDGCDIEDARGRCLLLHSEAALEVGQVVRLPDGRVAWVVAVPELERLGLTLSSSCHR